jgi:hypothetical protein
LQLVFDVFPVVCIGQVFFHAGDAWPSFCQLKVDLNEFDLVFWKVFFGIDGARWTFWDANGAVDTLIGVYDQKIWAFTETVNWANIYTVGVFALDARLGNYVCHGEKESLEIKAAL